MFRAIGHDFPASIETHIEPAVNGCARFIERAINSVAVADRHEAAVSGVVPDPLHEREYATCQA